MGKKANLREQYRLAQELNRKLIMESQRPARVTSGDVQRVLVAWMGGPPPLDEVQGVGGYCLGLALRLLGPRVCVEQIRTTLPAAAPPVPKEPTPSEPGPTAAPEPDEAPADRLARARALTPHIAKRGTWQPGDPDPRDLHP